MVRARDRQLRQHERPFSHLNQSENFTPEDFPRGLDGAGRATEGAGRTGKPALMVNRAIDAGRLHSRDWAAVPLLAGGR
jgi:hypothetical protein